MARGPGVHAECCGPAGPKLTLSCEFWTRMPADQPPGTKPRAFPGWCWDLGVWALGRSSGVRSHAWQGRLPEPELWGAVSPGGRRPSPPHIGLQAPPRPCEPPLTCPRPLGGPERSSVQCLGAVPPRGSQRVRGCLEPLWLEQLHKVSEARPKVQGARGQPLLSRGGAAKRADHGLQHGPPGGVARHVCSLSLTPSARDPAEPPAKNAAEGPGTVPAKPTEPSPRL